MKTIWKVSQVATTTQPRLLNASWKVSQVEVGTATQPPRSESLVINNGTLMRIVQLSEDGRVSAVLPERSDDLDPPALEEFVEFSEDGRVSMVLPERSDELYLRVHI